MLGERELAVCRLSTLTHGTDLALLVGSAMQTPKGLASEQGYIFGQSGGAVLKKAM